MKLHLTLVLGGLVAALAIVAGGCGGGEAQSAGDVPSDTTDTTETGPGESVEYRPRRVWLTRGEQLFAVRRQGADTEEVGADAMRLLLEGPNGDEAAAGVGTQIPAGTRYLKLTIEDGTATVDLTSEYESGGGSASMFARLAQVVYTLTEFPTVERVSFELDGKPVDVFSGEGILLEQPVTRADYEELLPAIVLEFPAVGDMVESPVGVTGTANVFEANVTATLLDANGKELVSRFTTATCGTGCRGDFSVDLPYQSAVEQKGTLVVHDDDADGDGKPSHEVRIPLTLTQG